MPGEGLFDTNILTYALAAPVWPLGPSVYTPRRPGTTSLTHYTPLVYCTSWYL
jgi:hypothetical protein